VCEPITLECKPGRIPHIHGLRRAMATLAIGFDWVQHTVPNLGQVMARWRVQK
jgi:hypothetical protein